MVSMKKIYKGPKIHCDWWSCPCSATQCRPLVPLSSSSSCLPDAPDELDTLAEHPLAEHPRYLAPAPNIEAFFLVHTIVRSIRASDYYSSSYVWCCLHRRLGIVRGWFRLSLFRSWILYETANDCDLAYGRFGEDSSFFFFLTNPECYLNHAEKEAIIRHIFLGKIYGVGTVTLFSFYLRWILAVYTAT